MALYSAYIFDMDGTMVDTMDMHHRTWREKLSELGVEMTLEEIKQNIHGKNEEILMRLFGEKYSFREVRRISWEKELAYRKKIFSELKLVEGLEDFLIGAREARIPMGVGTAAPPENVNFILDNIYGLREYFQAVVHAGMVTHGKPDPQVFQMVAEALGVPLSECLIFEDSPTGVETAQRAGCSAVVITTTHRKDEFNRFSNVVRFVENYSDFSMWFTHRGR